MIEWSTKRRMVFGISALILLTICALIIESNWTDAPHKHQKHFIIENNSTCWQKEPFSVIKDCEPCTAFEIKSQHQVCVHTHNKEVLQCEKSGEIVLRSCDKVAWLDEKNFYTFEFVLLIVGAISSLASYYRQRVLDNKVHLKIQRQLRQAV